ncbi:MAG: HNH endonuclease [Verrucomicrobiaceae bacterium]|nr:HNH endonuclease [Verrucomicrobiaceae bacterium]
METKRVRDDAWLLRVARRIAQELQLQSRGTALRVRRPVRVHSTDTDGWMAGIGTAGTDKLALEIWIDRYSGCPDRKFYAGFFSKNEKAIRSIASRSKSLWTVREVTDDDVTEGQTKRLKRRLRTDEFNEPVLESYEGQNTHFLGFFDRTQGTAERIEDHFCQQSVDFFLDAARNLPDAKGPDASAEVYPRCENRRLVQAHLARERSRYLATQCKDRDGYKCQVCGMDFASVYGKRLGGGFAEAHHKRPLSQRGDEVKTRLDDLITVCANCHRMLHRMEGGPEDVKELKALVNRNRVKRSG